VAGLPDLGGPGHHSLPGELVGAACGGYEEAPETGGDSGHLRVLGGTEMGEGVPITRQL
jgi:hypothetical protein